MSTHKINFGLDSYTMIKLTKCWSLNKIISNLKKILHILIITKNDQVILFFNLNAKNRRKDLDGKLVRNRNKFLKKKKTKGGWKRLTSFGCQTQICVRRRGLSTVGLGRWKGISLVFQRGWGSWWVSIGIGIFIEGNPARRRWKKLSNHVPKGLTVGSMIQTPGKYWGRASSHFLNVELGMRPKTTNCCLTIHHSPNKYYLHWNS